MAINKKTFSAKVEKDGGGLGPRQIKVLASNATMDRVSDILVPSGCKTSGRVTILADHDATIASVIGSGQVTVKSSGVETVITFLDEGIDKIADKACTLYKAGILTDVSVGFDPIDYDYDKSTGGYVFKTWELLELSCVVIGCNPDAKVTSKSLRVSATKAADFIKAKGLCGVANLAWTLSELGWAQQDAQWEADIEGDNSKVPAMLADALRSLSDAFLAMAKEEVDEMLAGMDPKAAKSITDLGAQYRASAIAGPKPVEVEQGGATADPGQENGTQPPDTNGSEKDADPNPDPEDETEDGDKDPAKALDDSSLILRARVAAI